MESRPLMNEQTPPPKLENIAAAIKFTTQTSGVGSIEHGDRARLVASLHVASSCWYSVAEARKHPDVMAILKEKLKLHLLRQLYHNQVREMHDALNTFWRTDRTMSAEHFDAKDAIMKLAKYAPPAGFDDDEFDCGSGPNCGCEQFEFLLTSRTK